MVLRSGKELDNKMSKKEHDKEKRLKSMESDLNNPSPSPDMSDPNLTYKPRVPYPQTLDAPFPSKKDKQKDNIL